MANISKKTWIILGSFPEISAAEIAAVLNLQPSEMEMQPPLLLLNKTVEAPDELMSRLGGTIKIAVEIGQAKTEGELVDLMANSLEGVQGKISFGISCYGSGTAGIDLIKLKYLGKSVKEIIRAKGRNARYVFKNEQALSSATVAHNDLLNKGAEFIVMVENGKYRLARTAAVQPFEDWGERDFGRPSRDDRSGMLPPKIARIMVNLSQANPADAVLLDPFCGSGTILAEALLAGFKKIIGSDISPKAVNDTKANLKWLAERRNLNLDHVSVISADVRKISESVTSADVIVTEPYLGPVQKSLISPQSIKNLTAELKDLYSSSLKQLTKVISPSGTIVMIIPRFKVYNDWYRLDLSDDIKKLGLTADPLLKTESREYGFLFYARENQRVGREIWRFKKASSS